MSFKRRYHDVQLRTWKFQKGAGDTRSIYEVACKLEKIAREIVDAISAEDPPDQNMLDFSEGEVKAAELMTELMFLSESCGWDIPETMRIRNTMIREGWRNSLGEMEN